MYRDPIGSKSIYFFIQKIIKIDISIQDVFLAQIRKIYILLICARIYNRLQVYETIAVPINIFLAAPSSSRHCLLSVRWSVYLCEKVTFIKWLLKPTYLSTYAIVVTVVTFVKVLRVVQFFLFFLFVLKIMKKLKNSTFDKT